MVGMTCLSNLAYFGSFPVGARYSYRSRAGNVVGPPPHRDLLDAVLVDGLLLVQTPGGPRSAFVELPAFATGIPVIRLSRAWSNVLLALKVGESYIEFEPFGGDESAGLRCFFMTFLREGAADQPA